ncbi:MAG TPA: sulfatase-like hydrolase/transferase [Pirellulales bacterium]|nr:sulfatase-like hydrolase/transferase [Pirellulales bacterium]
MNTTAKLRIVVFLAIGAVLGYVIAAAGPEVFSRSRAADATIDSVEGKANNSDNANRSVCLTEAMPKGQLLAMADSTVSATSAAPGGAPVVSGVPGSPSATTTIDGKYLPPPPPKFGGVINLSARDSKPWWPSRVVPPKGAPNILLIMTDDQGYGVSGTFGGIIPTPAMDRVAKMGLRYTQFHSTALCSPTRAALITGRNHHSVGFGIIGEQSTGYPGYDSTIGVNNATVGEILKQNGYATSWFGKNHNTPTYQYSIAGPFDQWPIGMGFEYFYGFMGGETDQWTPYLFRNTTQVTPWVGKPGYNLTTDLADEAIKYMNGLNAAAPDKPFFVYYVPGGTHSPHQPTEEWIEKFTGKFDMGWNELREQVFANQKRLGERLDCWWKICSVGRSVAEGGCPRNVILN